MQDIPEGLRPFFQSAELIDSVETWHTALCACHCHHYPTPIFSQAWESDYAAITKLIAYANRRMFDANERIGKASFETPVTVASF